jgi:hypothetical protein
MGIREKALTTFQTITDTLQKYNSPVLNWSGGKDSTALLHLLLTNRCRMPIIFYEDPWFPAKSEFMHALAQDWNLEIHNYPPVRVSLKHSPHMVALASEYLIGNITTLALFKNTIEYKDGDDFERFLCGVSFLSRPLGTYTYPFDVALIAHKDCDTDEIYGHVPLASQLVMRDDGPDAFFPFRDWTHDDVWDYTLEFKVPVQTDRYNVSARREWSNKDANSDWYPACIRCVDKRLAGHTVYCPKYKRNIQNVSAAAAEFGELPAYIEAKK